MGENMYLMFISGNGGNTATANGYRVSFKGNESVLKLVVVTVVQLCEYIKNQ